MACRAVLTAVVLCPGVRAASFLGAARAGAAALVTAGNGADPKATPLEASPESVTMQTWASLKETMGSVGDQVQMIELVRKDVSMLQLDLASQEKLWRQTELELSQENARLKKELESLQEEARAGASIRAEVVELRKTAQKEIFREREKEREFEGEEKQMAIYSEWFKQRAEQLSERLANVTEEADMEVEAARDRQEQLQNDTEVLRLNITALNSTLRERKAELLLLREEQASKTLNLQQQVGAEQEKLAQLQAELLPREQLQNEVLALQEQVEKETQATVDVKQARAEEAIRCQRELTARGEVLRAEETKAQAWHQDTHRLCEVVRGRASLLQEMLFACEGPKAALDAGVAVSEGAR